MLHPVQPFCHHPGADGLHRSGNGKKSPPLLPTLACEKASASFRMDRKSHAHKAAVHPVLPVYAGIKRPVFPRQGYNGTRILSDGHQRFRQGHHPLPQRGNGNRSGRSPVNTYGTAPCDPSRLRRVFSLTAFLQPFSVPVPGASAKCHQALAKIERASLV